MSTKITPEQMRNVNLSDVTKEYLVAYKMAEGSADKAYEQVEKMYGEKQALEIISPLYDAVYVMRKEILNLMMQHIDAKLGSSNCTEI